MRLKPYWWPLFLIHVRWGAVQVNIPWPKFTIEMCWTPQFLKAWLVGEKIKEVEEMAGKVVDVNHLKSILRDAKPHLRKAVYDQLKPHLKFKPPPYWVLSKLL